MSTFAPNRSATVTLTPPPHQAPSSSPALYAFIALLVVFLVVGALCCKLRPCCRTPTNDRLERRRVHRGVTQHPEDGHEADNRNTRIIDGVCLSSTRLPPNSAFNHNNNALMTRSSAPQTQAMEEEEDAAAVDTSTCPPPQSLCLFESVDAQRIGYELQR